VFSPVFLEKTVDAVTEMTPVGEFSRADAFVYTSVGSGITTVKSLVDSARQSPVRIGSINAGSALTIAMLAQALNIKYELIPFRTAEQILQALLANEVQVAVRSAGTYAQLVAAGRLHELATMSPTRSPFAANVPTLKELGVPVELVIANGFWAPPGTPKAIAELLNAEVAKALKDARVLEGLRSAYQYPFHSTPDQQVEHLKAENTFYAKGAAMTKFVRN
jgi:tripartite-type tricarboxylate transporter receptor subunit TctC